MSTSNRTLLTEAGIASLIVLAIVSIASPSDFGMPSLGVHPAWLPITLFAARYGPRGLLISLVVIAVPLLAVGAVFSSDNSVLFARVHNPSDVFALVIAVGATWIGMNHGTRVRRLRTQNQQSGEQRERAERAVRELSRTVEILRDRCDRMDTSVTLWRNLARRFEHGTPLEAAAAALELCCLRSGATAGIIEQLHLDGQREVFAHRGTWRMGHTPPRNLSTDATVCAAISTKRATRATEVPSAGEFDADVAVPIFDDTDHTVLGVIALRGIDPKSVHAAELHDFDVVAEWVSPQFARLSVKSRLRAVPEEGF